MSLWENVCCRVKSLLLFVIEKILGRQKALKYKISIHIETVGCLLGTPDLFYFYNQYVIINIIVGFIFSPTVIEVASGEYGNFSTALAQEVNINLSLDGDQCNHRGKAIELDFVSDSKGQNFNGISVDYQSQGDVVYISKDETSIDFSSCNQSFLPQKDENFAHYSVPFWTQFYVLFVRTLRSIIRDPILTLIRLLVHILIGILLGILYYDIGDEASRVLSNIGFLYFNVIFYTLISALTTTITFPLEIKVLIREHLNNWYSLKAYYLAKTFADTPFQIVYSFILTSISYFMTNQTREIERFLLIAALCILNTLVAQSIGLMVGAALNLQKAVLVVPFVIIPPLLFSGTFIVVSTIPDYIRWLSHISYLKYCYEGSVKITYGYNRSFLHCSEAFCLFKIPQKIMEQLDIQEDGLWIDFLMLFLFAAVVRIFGYFILRWRLRRKRG
ncbi:ATP-binding cassette sub-family G member 4 [Armadillidium vulgare]|nr:ATP-binding cassette sub-family G member 4 [Armadillidium vulgare]